MNPLDTDTARQLDEVRIPVDHAGQPCNACVTLLSDWAQVRLAGLCHDIMDIQAKINEDHAACHGWNHCECCGGCVYCGR